MLNNQTAISWKAQAIVDPDSVGFAKALEESLNNHTEQNYNLAQMMLRPSGDVVLLYQKVEYVRHEPGSDMPRIVKKEEMT